MKSDLGYNGNRPRLPQKLVELFTARGSAYKASVGCETTSLSIPVPNGQGTFDQVMFLYSGVQDPNGMEVWIPEDVVRNSAVTGNQNSSMTRTEWLADFAAELLALRPHLGKQFAQAMALSSFPALGSGYDPRKAALEYHLRQESLAPRPPKMK